MEEEATQPATQIVIDPRRLGQANSGLNEEDLADVCCILHPASLPAYKATALIHRIIPEYTLHADRSAPIRENYNGAHKDLDTFELDAEGIDSYDLGLRLSAKLKDPAGGFHFGRNPARCDFLIGQEDASRRISNVHFRIYINEFGILMLEDQSTNGTAVDGILLRGKDKENNIEYRHTIDNGTVIILTMTPPEEDYKFIVRIPHRESEAENQAYQNNLTAFFLRNQAAKMDNEARMAAANAPTKKAPLNLFPAPGATTGTPNASNLSTVTKRVKEWRGGNKYNKIGCIGKGAFAVVYKITAKFDGVPYAAKELEKRRFMKNGVLDQKVDMEMKIMRKIQHPNVVRYIEHVDWEDYLYIIMEFVPGGDLGSLIHEQQQLPESEVKTMAGQLLSALKYLHDNRITHRDVKPDNILIYSRDPFHVKLTDFGLSKMIDSEETFLRTFCGTLLYCAPEVYSEYREYDETGKRALRGAERSSIPKQRYGHAVDIWSLAGVLFYALCGSPPYLVQSGTTYQELLNHIMTQPLDIRPLQRAHVSDSGIRFVRSMLHTRPEYRATITDLETSSWLTGSENMEVSMEEEEEEEDGDGVDIVGDGITDPQLEAGTSQLSIHAHDQEINDSTEIPDNVSDLTEILPREIPGSFDTSDENLSLDDNYGYMRENANLGNGRLFGEINAAALGSSGAIANDHLNLPVLNREFRPSNLLDSELATETSRIEDSSRQLRSTTEFMPTIVTNITNPATTRHLEVNDQAKRSSSLMGAESMVGHLNMHSPSSAASPTADNPVPIPTTELRDPTMSLRRPREEEEIDDDSDWRPADLPAKRRRKSAREIDIPVPPSIFWDPKDKSTHHNNYPRMTTSDFHAYQEYAKSKGEKFAHGQRTFEMTMQSFRSSKSSRNSSLEPESSTRAHSEPTKEDNRQNLMKRDERNLSEVANGPGRASNGHAALDRLFPPIAHPSNTPCSVSTTPGLQPVVGNDFQPPKRILAKFLSTSTSALPTIALNITEAVTSWGRGSDNTNRYQNGMETKIPKYAFKLLLFKPGFEYAAPSLNTTQTWQEKDQDMKFFISTKASMGIWVNDVNILSHERQVPTTKSKYWCEIKHGDVVDVWRSERNPNLFVRFRFECFWGASRRSRSPNDNMQVLEEGTYLDELEDVCLNQERLVLAEIARREEEEKAALAREKEQEKITRNGSARPL